MTERRIECEVGILPDSHAKVVYSTVVGYLILNGWRREELGSGWWWKDGCREEATLGGALEQQLDSEGVDRRDAIAGEIDGEYWG